MKRIQILLFSLIVLFTSCASQEKDQSYTVRARIDNPDNYGPFYLAYPNGDKYVVDTNYTVDGDWIVFKGIVDEPVVASLGVRDNTALIIKADKYFIPGPSLDFILSNEEITIEGEANTIYMATVEGGKANKEWGAIKGQEAKWTQENWNELKNAYDNFQPRGDSVVFKNARELSAQNAEKDLKLRERFIKENPNSFVSIYFLAGMVNDLSLEKLKDSYAKLGEEYKSTALGERISGKIKNMEATAIGMPAIPINKTDINGNPVNLETLKGKYVLLDFWGSWCGPCRKAFPHLKELYSKYKKDGFEILGIAQEQRQTLEQNMKIWKETVKEDDLPWLQVLNNQGIEKFDAVKAYGVSAFPTQILLDKEGKIIARYVGESEELDKKLKEIFGS